MTLPRRLEPEWLDVLPADDPRAVHTRRDLKRVNALLGRPRAMMRILVKHNAANPPDRLLDLGAGDGTFALQMARRLASRWPGVTAVLLDRHDIVSRQTREAFAALNWNVETATTDVFDFFGRSKTSDFDIVISNLFVHHFMEDQLAGLLTQVAQACKLFVAWEPRRTRLAVRASRMLWALGCNDVMVHDAVLSARAGFNGQELSALWPSRSGWDLQEYPVGLFSHCFVARRTMSSR